jgi:hypothetical protein
LLTIFPFLQSKNIVRCEVASVINPQLAFHFFGQPFKFE